MLLGMICIPASAHQNISISKDFSDYTGYHGFFAAERNRETSGRIDVPAEYTAYSEAL